MCDFDPDIEIAHGIANGSVSSYGNTQQSSVDVFDEADLILMAPDARTPRYLHTIKMHHDYLLGLFAPRLVRNDVNCQKPLPKIVRTQINFWTASELDLRPVHPRLQDSKTPRSPPSSPRFPQHCLMGAWLYMVKLDHLLRYASRASPVIGMGIWTYIYFFRLLTLPREIVSRAIHFMVRASCYAPVVLSHARVVHYPLVIRDFPMLVSHPGLHSDPLKFLAYPSVMVPSGLWRQQRTLFRSLQLIPVLRIRFSMG